MLTSNKDNNSPLTLGVLGGGQLAKMIASAAYRMGINIAVIENGANTPAGDMTKLDFTSGWENKEDLDKFINSCDAVTLENEFINPDILEYISKSKPVYPSAATMRLAQDKFIQKTTFSNAGIPVPVFAEINSIESAKEFGKSHGFPYLIKTRTLGYDGYGNFTVHNENDIETAWVKFNPEGKIRPLMAEAFVNFTKELAVMAVRGLNGETRSYPCVETVQKNHICHKVFAPAQIQNELIDRARELALKCVESINGVGVFGVELFLTESGELLVNEIAPRPHNSGHYTIEACYASQYENCIRAVLGLPLGSPEMISGAACMVNLLGERDGSGVPSDVTGALKSGYASLHLYNKKSSRKGRKMGHITALGANMEQAVQRAVSAADALIW